MKNAPFILLFFALFTSLAACQKETPEPDGLQGPPTEEMWKKVAPPPDKQYYEAAVKACQDCDNEQDGQVEERGVICIDLDSGWGPVRRCFYSSRYCDTFLDFDVRVCASYSNGW